MLIFDVLRNVYIRWSLVLSIAALVIALGLSYFSLRNADHLLVVHFSSYQGIDFLGTKENVWNIVFSGAVIVFLNFLLAAALFYRLRFFSYLFSFFNIFASVLILIAVGVIISVN